MGLTVGESGGEGVDSVEDDGACGSRRTRVSDWFLSWCGGHGSSCLSFALHVPFISASQLVGFGTLGWRVLG